MANIIPENKREFRVQDEHFENDHCAKISRETSGALENSHASSNISKYQNQHVKKRDQKYDKKLTESHEDYFRILNQKQDYYEFGGDVPTHLDPQIEASFSEGTRAKRVETFSRIASIFIKMSEFVILPVTN